MNGLYFQVKEKLYDLEGDEHKRFWDSIHPNVDSVNREFKRTIWVRANPISRESIRRESSISSASLSFIRDIEEAERSVRVSTNRMRYGSTTKY